MAAGIEALVIAADLQGVSAAGNGLRNTLTGNRFGNTLDGAAGADTLDGGDGFDFASYASAASGVTVNLATGANPDGDTFISIEGVIGSSFMPISLPAMAPRSSRPAAAMTPTWSIQEMLSKKLPMRAVIR